MIRRWRIFVRNSEPEFFDSWEVWATSVREIFERDAIKARIGDMDYDELTITEIRGP